MLRSLRQPKQQCLFIPQTKKEDSVKIPLRAIVCHSKKRIKISEKVEQESLTDLKTKEDYRFWNNFLNEAYRFFKAEFEILFPQELDQHS